MKAIQENQNVPVPSKPVSSLPVNGPVREATEEELNTPFPWGPLEDALVANTDEAMMVMVDSPQVQNDFSLEFSPRNQDHAETVDEIVEKIETVRSSQSDSKLLNTVLDHYPSEAPHSDVSELRDAFRKLIKKFCLYSCQNPRKITASESRSFLALAIKRWQFLEYKLQEEIERDKQLTAGADLSGLESTNSQFLSDPYNVKISLISVSASLPARSGAGAPTVLPRVLSKDYASLAEKALMIVEIPDEHDSDQRRSYDLSLLDVHITDDALERAENVAGGLSAVNKRLDQLLALFAYMDRPVTAKEAHIASRIVFARKSQTMKELLAHLQVSRNNLKQFLRNRKDYYQLAVVGKTGTKRNIPLYSVALSSLSVGDQQALIDNDWSLIDQEDWKPVGANPVPTSPQTDQSEVSNAEISPEQQLASLPF